MEMHNTKSGEPRRPPPVAISLPSGFTVNGVTTWGVNLARELHQNGVPTTLVEHPPAQAPGYGAPSDLGDVLETSAPVVSWGFQRRALAGYLGLLARQPADEPVVFVPNYYDGLYALIARLTCLDHRVRTIGYCHSHDPDYYSLLPRYEPIIHKFVAVSDECLERLRQLMPHRVEDMVAKPYGVPAPLVRRARPDDGPVRLLYAGRLSEEQKRVSDLMRLAELLYDRGVDFELTIIGHGEASGRLERHRGQMPAALGNRVHLLGQVPPQEMADHYAEADISVLVSDYEGTSVFLLESLAHGCIPVVTAVGGARVVVANGENGFLHEVGDLPAMAETIANLERSPDERSRVSGRAIASSADYGMDAYVEWFVDLAREVAALPPRRWPAGRPTATFKTRLLQTLSPVLVPALKAARAVGG